LRNDGYQNRACSILTLTVASPPEEGHEPLMPTSLAHYDLHVWLFKNNPEDLFAPTNPAVKCTGYSYAMEMESTKLISQAASN
jgi:hypothetical protein